jgi:hypothetical protein
VPSEIPVRVRLRPYVALLAFAVVASGCDDTAARTTAQPTPLATSPQSTTPETPGKPEWILVAQFKGADTETTTRVFTIAPSPHPWRLTWLTYFALSVQVVDAKLGAVVESVRVAQSPGPPRIGDFRVCCPGDFYLRISAAGQYQIDIEQLR